MESSIAARQRIVAGLVRAVCTCCAVRQALVTQRDSDEAHRVCPASGQSYLDRGDGVFEPDGRVIARSEIVSTSPAEPGETPSMLSDRPKRTGPKTRIELERATFA